MLFNPNMNIQSINTITNNLYNNGSINQVSSMTFTGNSGRNKMESVTIDEMLLSKEINNSKELLKLVKQHKFKDAYHFLHIIKDDFEPMYQPANEKPLLLQIVDVKTKQSTKQDEYKNLIIRTIMANDKFDVDKKFKKRDRLGHVYETTYIEEAVYTGNFSLLLNMFDICDNSIEDPYNDFFLTLANTAEDNKHHDMAIFLNVLGNGTNRMFDDVDDEQQNGINATSSEQRPDDRDPDDISPSELLARTKVYFPENLPASIDEVGGLSKAKKDIEDYIITPWKPEIRKRLLDEKVSLPNGFLMYGPTGCGKTYITSVISKQTGYPLYSINVASVGSKWVNETSNNLKEIFDELAKQYKEKGVPSILFLDELDDMGGSRVQSDSPYKREDLNTLLTLLNNASERGIIVIGATNYIDILDKALTRSGRLDKKIEITLPNKEERKEILIKLLQGKSIADELLENIDLLAEMTDGKSPADLAKYVNNCARQTIFNNSSTITVEDFAKEANEPEISKGIAEIGFNSKA